MQIFPLLYKSQFIFRDQAFKSLSFNFSNSFPANIKPFLFIKFSSNWKKLYKDLRLLKTRILFLDILL